MRFMKVFLLSLGLVSLLIGCDGSGSSSDSSGDAPVTVSVTADYTGTSSSVDTEGRSRVPRPYFSTCLTSSYESAGVVAGLDCDSDGGVVAYESPTEFTVAIKRLSLVKTDNTKVDLIADTGTLAESEVINLANPVTLDISTIPQGTYKSLYTEFYYYDLTMELYDTADAKIRIYVSDDDFPAEGNLGNHQGDVKLDDDGDGNYDFVRAGALWQTGFLDTVRPAEIGGAAPDDSETGHDRGLYGDEGIWDTEEFMQGADQDIFLEYTSFDSNVTVGSTGGTITITFDLVDTWFYEDFNDNGKFEPCVATQSNEACSAVAEWTPVAPGVNFSFTE